MGSCYRILLTGYSAAYCFEFKIRVLRGFHGAAKRLTDERRNFDAALLNIQDYGSTRGKLGLRGRVWSFGFCWLWD